MPVNSFAQIQEPQPEDFADPITPYDEDLSSGIGFNAVINNFGFGIGVEYKRVVAPLAELTATLRWTGLRDVTEQTFTDVFFGQQIIPNKYQRAFSFPLTIGLRQRVFARQVSDNYRFYLEAGAGPVASFSYPYFDDRNNNGYRERFQDYFEPTNDVFTGLSEGEWHLGLAGEVKLSVDIGQNFSRLTSIQFGYLFYYFRDGIQMMQPNQPVRRDNVAPGEFPFELEDGELVMQPFFPSQQFFGTPQISFVFGRMW